jgi:hypothetical protein
MGTGQAYTTLIIEASTSYGHLNVFKHEWGHSLLNCYDAVRTAPLPTVTNHTDGNQYVNCLTGQMYVWADETEANLIANSIYNDESGFTHDYYSGTTSLASDPLRCLGITPAAWATGGPVSLPGELPALSPEEEFQAIQLVLRQFVEAGTLRSSWSRPLEMISSTPLVPLRTATFARRWRCSPRFDARCSCSRTRIGCQPGRRGIG